MAETLTLNAPPALLRKLDQTSQRYGELQDSLNDPAFVANPQKMIAAIKESGQLAPVVERYREYREAARQVAELTEMAATRGDPDMAALAQDELPGARAKAAELLEA